MDLDKLRETVTKTQSVEELIELEEKLRELFVSDKNAEKGSVRLPSPSLPQTRPFPFSKPTSNNWRKLSEDIFTTYAEIQKLLVVCEMCAENATCFLNYFSSVQDAFQNSEAWEAKCQHIAEQIGHLNEKVSQLQLPCHLLAEENELLSELRTKGKAAVNTVNVSKFSKEQQSVMMVKKEFIYQMNKLGKWTEKQVVNLEGEKENPEHLQSFAYGFTNRARELTSIVEKLFEKVQGVALDDRKVVKALREFGEMWFYLLDSLTERLSFAVIEVHDSTPLEALLSECLEMYFKPLLEFIGEVHSASTEKSMNVENLSSVLTTAEGLKDLQKMLESWRERYCLQKNAFNLFKEVALSRLTYVPSEDTVLSEQRQQETDIVVNELQSWVEEESRSESWSSVFNAFAELKKTVLQIANNSS